VIEKISYRLTLLRLDRVEEGSIPDDHQQISHRSRSKKCQFHKHVHHAHDHCRVIFRWGWVVRDQSDSRSNIGCPTGISISPAVHRAGNSIIAFYSLHYRNIFRSNRILVFGFGIEERCFLCAKNWIWR
jgi:hypothetical protein